MYVIHFLRHSLPPFTRKHHLVQSRKSSFLARNVIVDSISTFNLGLVYTVENLLSGQPFIISTTCISVITKLQLPLDLYQLCSSIRTLNFVSFAGIFIW